MIFHPKIIVSKMNKKQTKQQQQQVELELNY